MAAEKTEVTQDHIDAIKKVILLVGSPKALASLLNVHRTNVYLWLNGYQPIPLKHAETLAKKFPADITALILRPDILQYEKYFN